MISKTLIQSSTSQPLVEEIRTLAYHLWREANGSPGQDLEFWLKAEQQIMARVPATEAALPDRLDRPTHAEAEVPLKPRANSRRNGSAKPVAGKRTANRQPVRAGSPANRR